MLTMGTVSRMPEAQNPGPPPAGAGGAEPRYKIGDVCRIADVQPYVLRYWESEFPGLAPDRTIAGPRTYSLRELRLIEQIKKLLYDEGYTIAGAKKKLDAEWGGKGAEAAPPPESPKPKEKEPKGRTARSAPETTELPFPGAPGAGQGGPLPARAAPPAATDPRIPRAVAELKEILRILSRRP